MSYVYFKGLMILCCILNLLLCGTFTTPDNISQNNNGRSKSYGVFTKTKKSADGLM